MKSNLRAPCRGRAAVIFTAVILAVLAFAGTASAGHRPSLFTPLARAAHATGGCGSTRGLVCPEVDVPLDRTGLVPGSVKLHVEVLHASGVQRGVMFLVAGGPGQGSATTFDLGSRDNAALFRFLFPGYTLVAYDDRGTGRSSALDCGGFDAYASDTAATRFVGDCAAAIGPPRDFYDTADHAEDLEAVRAALGFDRIGIYGVSYGTKLALAYALAHPTRVERLLLDSVVAPDENDPFGTQMLKAMPATLAAYCPGALCSGATSNFAGDVVTLANRLAVEPLSGRVLLSSGKTATAELDATTFLDLVVGADLDPGLAAELPAAVHAALAGNPHPLLHLLALPSPDDGVSPALYLATVCHDGPFPWQSDTPLADRPAAVQAALSALPPGSFGPFGPWAGDLAGPQLCLGWPSPAGGLSLGAGPLPDVPVLAVSGGLDLRTPTAVAASVVSRFRQGRLLVVPGVGHSVLTSDLSGCSQAVVHLWILGAGRSITCKRPKPMLGPLAAFPSMGSTRQLDAGETLSIVTKTIREAEAVWLMTAPHSAVAGLASGSIVPRLNSFTLVRYGIAPGVTVSGRVTLAGWGPPLTFKGRVRVTGAAAAPGGRAALAARLTRPARRQGGRRLSCHCCNQVAQQPGCGRRGAAYLCGTRPRRTAFAVASARVRASSLRSTAAT
jgi:pimeloyl-ACP methyl ester carboxylesterase